MPRQEQPAVRYLFYKEQGLALAPYKVCLFKLTL